MADNLILLFFGALIGGLILFIVYFQISKYLRGTLKIHLDKNHVGYGEKISGELNFYAKKDIEAYSLKVMLIGEKQVYRNTNGDSKRSWEQIYEDTEILSREEKIPMGSRNTTAFTMKLPELSDISNISSGLSVDMTQYIPSKMRPFLKKMVNTAFSQHYRWRLRAELDCKGINFTSRETLYLKEKTIGEI